MKKIDLGQMITILANVGVIAGIVFLGFELRQNQLVGQAQTRNEISRAFIDIGQFNASDTMPEVLVRVRRGETLSAEDELRARSWASGYVRLFENLHYQYRIGLFDEIEYETHMRGLQDGLNNDALLRDRFCESRQFHEPSYVAAWEALLTESCD